MLGSSNQHVQTPSITRSSNSKIEGRKTSQLAKYYRKQNVERPDINSQIYSNQSNLTNGKYKDERLTYQKANSEVDSRI